MDKKLLAELNKYAAETGDDIGEDFAAGIRAMRDEPGEVARGISLAGIACTTEDVIEWCNAHDRK